jgi:hypothetical protein
VAHEPRRLLGKGEEEERKKDDIAHLGDLVYSIFYVTSQGGYDKVGNISASATSLGLGREGPFNGERNRLHTSTESLLYNPVDDSALVVDFVLRSWNVLFTSDSEQARLAAAGRSNDWPKPSSASLGAFGTGVSEGYVGECCVSMRARAETADVRRRVECIGGNEECNKTISLCSDALVSIPDTIGFKRLPYGAVSVPVP